MARKGCTLGAVSAPAIEMAGRAITARRPESPRRIVADDAALIERDVRIIQVVGRCALGEPSLVLPVGPAGLHLPAIGWQPVCGGRARPHLVRGLGGVVGGVFCSAGRPGPRVGCGGGRPASQSVRAGEGGWPVGSRPAGPLRAGGLVGLGGCDKRKAGRHFFHKCFLSEAGPDSD